MGNPVDGFDYIGPFNSFDEADDYINQDSIENFWIARLVKPEEE
jgi:hypothetical protein